ncbi:hypothetical protein MJ570_13970 [Escherichia coli]|nr:hypothetical protein MJ570_13970 [Escherichia coli]
MLHALLKQQENWSMQSPFWEADSEDDYRGTPESVEYLIEEDDTNPPIDFLASRIAEYENNNEKVCRVRQSRCSNAWCGARTLIDQHNRPMQI